MVAGSGDGYHVPPGLQRYGGDDDISQDTVKEVLCDVDMCPGVKGILVDVRQVARCIEDRSLQ